jgi:hypothetical protein
VIRALWQLLPLWPPKNGKFAGKWLSTALAMGPAMRLASAALLAGLVLLPACGPAHRYASSEPTYLRFDLAPAEYPESVSRWYACFAFEDADYRQLCLSRTPGVHVQQGPGLLCDDESNWPNLCRAFPLFVPDAQAEVDDDNAGGAILEAFGQLFLAILETAADSDDDDDDEDHGSDSSSDDDDDDDRPRRRAAPRRADDAPHSRSSAHQRDGRANQRR